MKRRKKNRKNTTEPFVPELTIRFIDAHLVVVDKPAGITTMRHRHETAAFGDRARKYLPPTLMDLLPHSIARHHPQQKQYDVYAVHRLDKDTSGLVVFARSKEAERHLGRQFRDHSVKRRYLAIVRGNAQTQRVESLIVRDRGDGRRGSLPDKKRGKRAVTHVAVLEQLGEFSLVECRLETGRTHQVRIHLGEAGTPLCGERIYDRSLHGQPLPDGSDAKRPLLHAASLAIQHPLSGKQMSWRSSLPQDMKSLLRKLRKLRS